MSAVMASPYILRWYDTLSLSKCYIERLDCTIGLISLTVKVTTASPFLSVKMVMYLPAKPLRWVGGDEGMGTPLCCAGGKHFSAGQHDLRFDSK